MIYKDKTLNILKDNLTEDNLDMWFDFKDRHFMANVLFPTIGKYLENKESKRVLDIGIESYNLADRELCMNDDIEFYGLDSYVHHPKKPKRWNNIYNINLTENNCFSNYRELHSSFDIIIDYGVLGWEGANIRFSDSDFINYLQNITYILDDDGLYFLKIDLDNYDKNNSYIEKIRNLLNKYFDLSDFYNIEYFNIENEYETYVLKKNKKVLGLYL